MENQKYNYWKIYFKITIVLCLLLGIIYWACGEQLYYCESNGNKVMENGNCVTAELAQGVWVEQYFEAKMDRIDCVGIMLTSNGHQVDSDIYFKVKDCTTDEDLGDMIIPASEIGVNQVFYMKPTGGWTNIRGHWIQVFAESVDGQIGTTASAVYTNEVSTENCEFYIKTDNVPGQLSYSVDGVDDVMWGRNYLFFAFVVFLIVSIIYWVCVYRYKRGKREYVFAIYGSLKSYSFLLEQIINRDFKVKYKRSILGVFWSFLNPVLTMVVQYVVFSQLFKTDIENYPVYLLTGTVIFGFFTDAANLSLNAIVGNASLITKVYVPKYIYPVTRVLSSSINLLISLIPLAVVLLATGEPVTRSFLLIPYVLLCVLMFTIGIGMMLSALMVFFRDLQFLWGIISLLWMYATPLFYPESIIPEQFLLILKANPMYYYVTSFRTIVLDGISPTPERLILCAVIAGCSCLIGACVFKKTQNQFVLYL